MNQIKEYQSKAYEKGNYFHFEKNIVVVVVCCVDMYDSFCCDSYCTFSQSHNLIVTSSDPEMT